ncbi:MAG: MBL fold metallo-hydrolase [Deltaproteobacteria bacterium]|nr:MBL fold metallo-hydrolase [Deltaproteobacteria bacterium]
MLAQILKNLVWFGHSGFCLEAGGKTVYFDPFRLSGELKAADIILVSHEHYDHCSPEDIAKLLKPGTILITEPMAAAKLQDGLETRIMRPGEHIQVGDIMVEAVPAYNINKRFHPRGNNWLGFVIDIAGVKIYHAGDTDYIPEMQGIDTDIALLPVSGIYVMTPREAAQAAIDIKPQVAIPMHYGSLVGDPAAGHEFKQELAGRVRVELTNSEIVD